MKKLRGLGGRSVKTCASSAQKLVKSSTKPRRYGAAEEVVSRSASRSSSPAGPPTTHTSAKIARVERRSELTVNEVDPCARILWPRTHRPLGALLGVGGRRRRGGWKVADDAINVLRGRGENVHDIERRLGTSLVLNAHNLCTRRS